MQKTFSSILFLFGILFIMSQANAANPTPGTCPPGQHWVRSHPRRAFTRTDGTPVSATYVSACCKPNPTAYKSWNTRLKEGMPPGWIQIHEKQKEWGPDEQERVLEALSDLPASLLVDKVRGIYRLEKSSSDDENPASGQPGEIALYDPAFDPKQNLTRILAHEFAHEIFRQYSKSEEINYLAAADWIVFRNTKTGETRFIPNRDNYVEDDGKESPSEDFSNNLEYYLFDPNTLKEKTPKVFDWIQNKFGANFKLVKGS